MGSRRLLPLAITFLWIAAGLAGERKFYPDDPIARDPETQDASGVQPWDVSAPYDLVENSFLGAGDRTEMRALNVNTIDQVPDSSWFTNRIGPAASAPDGDNGMRPMSVEEFAKGPDRGPGPAVGLWTITDRKSEGVTPGFTIRDSTGQRYWIKFDPKSNPEMASGAEVISTKFFHAVGYHVPENYLAVLRPDMLTIDPGARAKDVDGRDEPMTPRHVKAVLDVAARQADGTYRVLASKELPGRPVGPFRYHGTRPDDPNDIFPHEHRRELRGLEVFSAWLNHDEVRSTNTLDTLVRDGSRTIVRHHLLDFGSTLGSGSVKAQSRRAGNEFLWESRPTLITMLTLGLYVRPWLKVDYPDYPAVGRLESAYFQPDQWKPEYPNPAFRNARPEDRFWAARIVAAVPPDAVGAIVATARYADPRVTDYVTETLLVRRTKVLKTWLNGTNPLIDLALSASGELTFRNAAELAGVAEAAERYTVEWSRFDNDSGAHETAGGEGTFAAPPTTVPAALRAARPEYISARLRAFHPEQPAWSQPLVAYFRRAGDGWTLVGLERNP
jgi:hypothetical protein